MLVNPGRGFLEVHPKRIEDEKIQTETRAMIFYNQDYLPFANEGLNSTAELIQIIEKHLLQNLGTYIEAELLLNQSGHTGLCST